MSYITNIQEYGTQSIQRIKWPVTPGINYFCAATIEGSIENSSSQSFTLHISAFIFLDYVSSFTLTLLQFGQTLDGLIVRDGSSTPVIDPTNNAFCSFYRVDILSELDTLFKLTVSSDYWAPDFSVILYNQVGESLPLVDFMQKVYKQILLSPGSYYLSISYSRSGNTNIPFQILAMENTPANVYGPFILISSGQTLPFVLTKDSPVDPIDEYNPVQIFEFNIEQDGVYSFQSIATPSGSWEPILFIYDDNLQLLNENYNTINSRITIRRYFSAPRKVYIGASTNNNVYYSGPFNGTLTALFIDIQGTYNPIQLPFGTVIGSNSLPSTTYSIPITAPKDPSGRGRSILFYFDAKANDVITAYAYGSTNSTLFRYLTLYDLALNSLKSVSGNGNTAITISSFTLPFTGRYYIALATMESAAKAVSQNMTFTLVRKS